MHASQSNNLLWWFAYWRLPFTPKRLTDQLQASAPDQMVVSGSIETREKTVAEASAANAELVKRMRAAIKALEIPDNNVSSERIAITAIKESSNQWRSKAIQSVRPANPPALQNNSDNPFGNSGESDANKLRKPVGFSVVRYFEITISDLRSYEMIYKALVKSGVTQVNPATLRTTELRKYRDQARLEAVKAAREKAVAMAGVLDANLAGVKSIRESNEGFGSPFQNVRVGFSDAEPAPAGTMSVSATVDVQFFLGNTEFSADK